MINQDEATGKLDMGVGYAFTDADRWAKGNSNKSVGDAVAEERLNRDEELTLIPFYADFTQIIAPTAPPSGFLRVYSKSTGSSSYLYTQTPSGVEVELAGTDYVSLDIAYNNGSSIAVDNTNVDWKLGTGKEFTITNSTASSDYVKITPTALTLTNNYPLYFDTGSIKEDASHDLYFQLGTVDKNFYFVDSNDNNIITVDTSNDIINISEGYYLRLKDTSNTYYWDLYHDGTDAQIIASYGDAIFSLDTASQSFIFKDSSDQNIVDINTDTSTFNIRYGYELSLKTASNSNDVRLYCDNNGDATLELTSAYHYFNITDSSGNDRFAFAPDWDYFYTYNPNVAHGMTDLAPTNTYGIWGVWNNTMGGVHFSGYTDGDGNALVFDGYVGIADPTDSLPTILFIGNKKNGTTSQALAAAETICAWRNTSSGNDEIAIRGNGDMDILNGNSIYFKSDGNDKSLSIYHNDTDGHIITSSGDLHLEPTGGDTVITGNLSVTGAFTQTLYAGTQGTDITSANNATLTATGNYFDVTGAVQMNTLSVPAGITAGTIILLQFDAAPLVKHGTAGTGAQFQLSGAGDFQASAGDTLMLVYDGTYYREFARTAI